jgi:hypothetical protein
MALWIGIYPKPFFQILEQPALQISRNVREGARNANVVAVAPAPGSAVPADPDATKGKN